METRTMTLEQIENYGKALRLEERCEATVQKYVGAATALFDFLPEGKVVTRELALAWKAEISVKNAAGTVNVMLSAVNRFFAFMSWDDIRRPVAKPLNAENKVSKKGKSDTGAFNIESGACKKNDFP